MMIVQKVTLTLAYNPSRCDTPESWDWYALLDIERDCQLLKLTATPVREPTEAEEQAIREWDE